MTPQLSHPSSATLLGELDTFFHSKRIYTKRDRRLVFLCGGPVNSRKPSFRRKLLKYARESLTEFRFFLAEDAARDLFKYGEPVFINVAEFEALLIDLADCVIVIPESPGSIAELGYFSAQKQARDKLLVVSDLEYQGDDSFLSLGPIELVNRHSKYRPTLYLNLKSRTTSFRPITKILKRYALENRGHFEYKTYDLLPIQHKLFVIFELIYLFGMISYDAIEFLIEVTFNGGNPLLEKEKQYTRQLLSILTAGHYVQRSGEDGLLVPMPQAKPFLDIQKSDRNSLKIKIADFVRRTSSREARSMRRRHT